MEARLLRPGHQVRWYGQWTRVIDVNPTRPGRLAWLGDRGDLVHVDVDEMMEVR